MSEKSLLEFIKALDQLNGANLHYLTGRDAKWYKIDEKYRDELKQVIDLINSFEFVGPQPIHHELLKAPMPYQIRDIFGEFKKICPNDQG